MELSISLINKMKHMIGFRQEEVKQGKFTPYRNHYSDDFYADLEEACKKGLVKKRRSFTNYYFLTEEGYKVLEQVLSVRFCKKEWKVTKNELKYFIEAKGIEVHLNGGIKNSVMFIESFYMEEFSELLGNFDNENVIDCGLLPKGCLGVRLESLISNFLFDEFENNEEIERFIELLEE